MITLFTITAALLYADQNVLAPNVSSDGGGGPLRSPGAAAPRAPDPRPHQCLPSPAAGAQRGPWGRRAAPPRRAA
jgi:hypothetical protein